METLHFACILAALGLTACTAPTGSTTNASSSNNGMTTAANIGGNIFKVAVDSKCRSTLESNSSFRTVALAMSAEQQSALETQICGCVSEKAPQNVTAVELAQAAMDQNARNQIVANTVSKTLNACASDYINK